MADPQLIPIPVPHEGYDTDTAPEALKATLAPAVQNFLVDRPGRLPIRGPINEATRFYSATTAGPKPVGAWVHNDTLLVGMRALSATAFRDPWTTPYRKPSSAAALSAPDTTAYHVDLNTEAVTSVTVTTDTAPGPRFTRIGGSVYGVALGSTSTVNENGGILALTKLLRWDGTAAVPVVYTNAPQAAQDVKAHYERLFVLGGRSPAGTGTIGQNTLWFSDPVAAAALPDTVAAWSDDTSGLVNQIVIDADDANDFGVGLAKVGQNLAVFKRRSIHVLAGHSPSTFMVRTVSSDIGCLDARSIVEADEGCFFMSDQGFMWFDGTELVPVDRGIRQDLLFKALEAVGDNGTDGGYVTAGRLQNGYVMVNVGVADSKTATDSAPSFSGLFHVPRAAWSTLTSDALHTDRPLLVGRSTSKQFVVDDVRIAQVDKLTAPELEPSEAARGIDTSVPLWRWTGTPTFTGAGNTLKNGDGLDMFPAAVPSPINAKFSSRFIGGGYPTRRAQLSRLTADYNFQVDGAASDGLNAGWFVKLVDPNGTVVLAEYQLPGQADPASTAFPYRRRHVKDAFGEAKELQLIVEWRGTALGLAKADLQGFHLVLQQTHQRRSD